MEKHEAPSEIIKKIHKLLRLSESSNAHEAALAAAMAQKLMNEWKLSEADMDSFVVEQTNPVGENWVGSEGRESMGSVYGYQPWKAALLTGIAKVNGCMAIRYPGNRLKLVGRESDRQVVEYLACLLMREVERLGCESFAKQGYIGNARRRTYVNNFGLGAAAEIIARMKAEKAGFTAANPTMTALVLRDDKAVERYKQEKIGKTRGASLRCTWDVHAQVHGRAAGKSVQWNAGVGTAGAPRQIS